MNNKAIQQAKKLIGHGYASAGRGQDVQMFHFQFFSDGSIYYKLRGEYGQRNEFDFLGWGCGPVDLDSLLVLDFKLFEEHFSAWDD